jgi:hypothetical protein
MKRFTETTKWRDSWFRKLPLHRKLLWQYICDACDHAGVFEFADDVFTFDIGHPITEGDLAGLGDRITKLEGDKWIVSKFIPFQYGTLSRDCKPHSPVFAALSKHGIEAGLVGGVVSRSISTPINETLSKGLVKPINGLAKGMEPLCIGSENLQEKEKEKDNTKKGVSKGEEDFEKWWLVYPRKVGKVEAKKAFARATANNATLTVERLVEAVWQQRKSPDWLKEDGRYIPHPSTWLNQGRWEDELLVQPQATLQMTTNGNF